jgi:hypothetical protein
MEPLVDADGNPIAPGDPGVQPGVLGPGDVPPGGWPDEIIRSGGERAPQPAPQAMPRTVPPPIPRAAPAQRPPPGPRSVTPTDPLQPRPDPAQ